MEDYSIPRGGTQALEETLKGYYLTASVGDEVDEEKVANEADISKDNNRRQRPFFNDIGALNKDGYDYDLTEEGYQLGRLFAHDKRKKAKSEIRDLLLD